MIAGNFLERSQAVSRQLAFLLLFLLYPGYAETNFSSGPGNPDEWFKQIKGKHRIVFDVPHPNEIFPFAWPRIFLATNAATGTAEKDCSIVVVLRHTAIPYAMEDRLWSKYNFGETFKADDPKTKKPSTRNPFWKPKQGDFNIPGVGVVPIGINELQDSGVLFCVCDMALTVYSGVVAQSLNLDTEGSKKRLGKWITARYKSSACRYLGYQSCTGTRLFILLCRIIRTSLSI